MKRLFIVLMALLEILISVSPFLSYVKQNIWANQTSVGGFASTLATYVGIQFLCLSALVYLVVLDSNDQMKSKIDDFELLIKKYTPLTVRPLKENEFYKDFLGSCVKANHYVSICYFAPQPPENGGSTERLNYYREMIKIMRNNPTTQFRRIIRDTPANRIWTRKLVSELLTPTNCTIAMLSDRNEDVSMPLALSVQIVDGTMAWLVAVSEHAGAPVYRDVAIENPTVVEVLNKYFDRLWGLSRVVFQPGFNETQSGIAIDGGH
jgi:hypothetical protein